MLAPSFLFRSNSAAPAKRTLVTIGRSEHAFFSGRTASFRLAGYARIARLDILGEGSYLRLECLLQNSASASNCCKGLWTC